MRVFRAIFAIGLLFLAGGSTECQFFSDTTIPATDRTAPTPFGALWRESKYLALQSGDVEFTYPAKPGEKLILVSGGMDAGGVARSEMYGVSQQCCKMNSSACEYDDSPLGPVRDLQVPDGGPVSSGIWVGLDFTMPKCATGLTTTWSKVMFWSVTWDYHGNETRSPTYTAEYGHAPWEH